MKIRNIITLLALAAVLVTLASCADHKEPVPGGEAAEGLLDITVSFGQIGTRLAELSRPEDMNQSVVNGKDYGLSHVGLYIYYSADYNQDDLRYPYVKNLKCEIDGNKLVPVIGTGQGEIDKSIFIYDDMTLVAFYPYNEQMTDVVFEKKADEEQYPITRNDYAEQYYIPYRAQTRTNPTVSYYTEMTFYPKHTYKVEIVVVSDEPGDLTAAEDDILILPNIDPVDTPDTDVDGRRMKWFDGYRDLTDRGGGSNVRQYWAYIWHTESGDNDIPQGEVLLQAGRLTLIASQDVPVQEQHVYRYGYNMSTGEIFIPTSTNLVWDAESLASFTGGRTDTYQVCDIDLDGISWIPTYISQGRYDGGGHKVLNLNVSGAYENAGLFAKISNNSTVCNVNLVEPQITVTADSARVGALCGQVGGPPTQEEIDRLLSSLPPNLSDVVKQAIIKDMLADAFNSTSRVAGCRVEDPAITVNGVAPVVGTVIGSAGDRDEEGDYRSLVWSCYNLGGTLTVNAGHPALNEGGYAGGFCGLNNGGIRESYTTIAQGSITFDQLYTDPVTGGQTLIPDYTGFTTTGDLYTAAEGAVLDDNYSVIAQSTGGVSQMPGSWPSWTSKTEWWPVLTTGWLAAGTSYWYDAGSPGTYYPILQWERR